MAKLHLRLHAILHNQTEWQQALPFLQQAKHTEAQVLAGFC